MQLRNNNALSTVDDERTVSSHQWDFAQVNFLFFYVTDAACFCFFINIKYDQTKSHLDRSRESHTTLTALIDVVFCWLKSVAYELKACSVVEICDREHRFENAIETSFATAIWIHIFLNESFVRRFLQFNQIWNINDLLIFCERLSNSNVRSRNWSFFQCTLRNKKIGTSLRGEDAKTHIK
ncbi:hypothetical protein D3C87_1623110 [compost metagenome]